jgi:hypothetical protein
MLTEGNNTISSREELDLEEIIGSLPPLPPGTSDELEEMIEAAIEEAFFGDCGNYADLASSSRGYPEPRSPLGTLLAQQTWH